MGTVIIVVLLLATLVTIIISIKIEDLRKWAFAVACFCAVTCFMHYLTQENFNRKFARLWSSNDVKTKLNVCNAKSFDASLKKYLMYSIVDNVENSSPEAFDIFLNAENEPSTVKEFFDIASQRGLFLTDRQVEKIVTKVVENDKAIYKDYIFPSAKGYKAVLTYAGRLLENPEGIKEAENLKLISDAFPELFNDREKKLFKMVLESKQGMLEAEDFNMSSNAEMRGLQKQLRNLLDERSSYPINYVIRGIVVKSVGTDGNTYLLNDANIQGQYIGRCIVKVSSASCEAGKWARVTVKTDGEQEYELEGEGYVSLKTYSEDNSSEAVEKLTSQINSLQEKIRSIEGTQTTTASALNENINSFESAVQYLKDSIEAKVKVYDI